MTTFQLIRPRVQQVEELISSLMHECFVDTMRWFSEALSQYGSRISCNVISICTQPMASTNIVFHVKAISLVRDIMDACSEYHSFDSNMFIRMKECFQNQVL